MHAIVLAGGRGVRLRPLTADRPKALAELGGVPILEILIRQLARAGFQRLTLCVSHLSQMIEERFADGARYGIAIDYSRDTTPLGTAGPLRAVPRWDSTALVMNCDVLTTLDFRRLFADHQRSRASMTVATRHDVVTVQTGVLDVDAHGRICEVWEKPRLVLDTVAGIYVMQPRVRDLLPDAKPVDMPELIRWVCQRDELVRVYRFTDAWHDIGTPGQFEDAGRAFLASPEEFLGTPTDPAAGSDTVPAAADTRDRREEHDLAEVSTAVRLHAAGPDRDPGTYTLRVVGDHLAGTV